MGNIKQYDEVKSTDNVKPVYGKLSDSTRVLDNPLDSVKPSDKVRPLDTVKQLDCVSGMEDTKTVMSNTIEGIDDTMLQVVGSSKCKTMPLCLVLKQLNLARHSVLGDGSCLFGFITRTSRGDRIVSNHLRQLIFKMMSEHPDVRLEEGLSVIQWLEKKQRVMDPAEWGGDMEVRLLAIGLQRDIMVITGSSVGSYARKFLCQPPPVPKMSGGIFISLTCDDLCAQWQSVTPQPLVIIFNGFNH